MARQQTRGVGKQDTARATDGVEHEPMITPLTITIEQAARRIGVGKSILYPHVMCGNLPSVALGSRERRVLTSELPAFLHWLWEQQRETLAAS